MIALTNDLAEVPVEASVNVRQAIEIAARVGRDVWRKDAQAFNEDGSLRAYPYSIDYDINLLRDGVEAEIGPNPSKNQGTLGIVEEATGDIFSPPRYSDRLALEKASDDLQRGVEKIAEAFL